MGPQGGMGPGGMWGGLVQDMWEPGEGMTNSRLCAEETEVERGPQFTCFAVARGTGRSEDELKGDLRTSMPNVAVIRCERSFGLLESSPRVFEAGPPI